MEEEHTSEILVLSN